MADLPDVALAVDAATADLTPGDSRLRDALVDLGIDARPVVWDRAPRGLRVVVLRSTWDYVERPDVFKAWLDDLDAAATIVLNPTDMLRWNLHKGYLADLDVRGVPVVPTVVLPRGASAELHRLMAEHDWDDVVVKPAIGGTARLAVHAGRAGIESTQAHLTRLLDGEDAVIQPFVHGIEAAGEVSVVAVDGVPLLAVRKTAAPGEWRVQSEFGGTAAPVELTADLVQISRQVLDAIEGVPLYARIDLVEGAGGEPRVMELELVEPELFLQLDANVGVALAASIARRIDASGDGPSPSTGRR